VRREDLQLWRHLHVRHDEEVQLRQGLNHGAIRA
jgi:hypothetical protein